MDPNQSTSHGPELPLSQPQNDMIPTIAGHEPLPPSPETHQQPSAPSLGMPTSSQIAQNLASAQSAQPPVALSATSVSTTSPAVADDLDLIEKEWVEKAKAIVAQTRHDPFVQNKEINKFKADYMQKRYKKEIKIEP